MSEAASKPGSAGVREGERVGRVVVVGGGLAGMACGVALQEAGARVTLIEARQTLGGRAGSFEDVQSGETLDNCQHVLLGCCTNLLDLYRRMGVADKIRWERTVHFMNERGDCFDLWGARGVPAPLHMGAAMAVFGALTLGERVKVARAMMAMLRLGKEGREALEGISFGQWLRERGQTDAIVEKFYDPVLVSALNEHSRLASAKYAIQVFQDAMLAHEQGYVMGLPACPLGELYKRLPVADVRLGTRVEEILFAGGAAGGGAGPARALGVKLRDGTRLDAEAVVLATNHHAVQRWVSAELQAGDARFAGLARLESVPILGVHLWFDRPVMAEPAVALIKGPLQWLFRKDEQGQVLHGVISAAREWADIPKEEALRQFEVQIRGLFSRAREAKLDRGVIVIEKRATFAPLPGTDVLRPMQGPGPDGIRGLYLAGDYTKTGWPATMEGAVRGGYLAA